MNWATFYMTEDTSWYSIENFAGEIRFLEHWYRKLKNIFQMICQSCLMLFRYPSVIQVQHFLFSFFLFLTIYCKSFFLKSLYSYSLWCPNCSNFRMKMEGLMSTNCALGYTQMLWTTMCTWNHIMQARMEMLQMLVQGKIVLQMAMRMVEMTNYGGLVIFSTSVIFVSVSAYWLISFYSMYYCPLVMLLQCMLLICKV